MAAYAQQWQNQPLPPGWEAKYDERTTRYFFIDHKNKKTSWEDPRIKYHQHQHQQAQQQLHPQPQQQQQQQGRAASPSRASPRAGIPAAGGRSPKPAAKAGGEDIPMQHFAVTTRTATATTSGGKPKCSECGQRVVDTVGEQCWQCTMESKYGITMHTDEGETNIDGEEGDEESTPTEGSLRFGVNPDNYKLLKDEFPSADDELLQTLMIRCSNNADKVFQKLVTMGYERRGGGGAAGGAAAVSSPTPSSLATNTTDISRPRPKSGALSSAAGGGHSRSASPALAQPPQPPAQPAQPAPSPAKKMQLRDRLHAQYSDLAVAVIDMALNSCDFDEAKASHLLKTLSHQSPTRPGTASITLSPTSTNRSSGGVTSPAGGSSAADPAGKRARSSSPRPAAAPAPGVGKSILSKSDKRPEGKGKSSTVHVTVTAPPTSKKPSDAAAAGEGKPQPGKQRSKAEQGKDKARTSGEASRIKKSSPAPAARAATAHSKGHAGQIYHSALRCKPNGPNPRLAKGPDDKLLLKEYIQWCGPNKENCKGPQVVTGPAVGLAKGPDHSLVKGPQAANRKGPIEAKDNYVAATS